jgi:hypothetical protein
VAVTAVVFVAWFSAVERLGAERTGLFNGLVPIASLIAVAVIGTGTVTGMQLAGALSVLVGVTLGLTQRAGSPADTRRPQRYPPPQQTRPGEPARQLTALLARAHEEHDADGPPGCIQRRRLLDRDDDESASSISGIALAGTARARRAGPPQGQSPARGAPDAVRP